MYFLKPGTPTVTSYAHGLAGFRIQRDAPPVDHRSDDFALRHRDAAMHDAAADLRPYRGLVYLGVPPPALLASADVQGKDYAPVRHTVQGTVPFERRTFLIAS